jgi:hypothetical protein
MFYIGKLQLLFKREPESGGSPSLHHKGFQVAYALDSTDAVFYVFELLLFFLGDEHVSNEGT